MLWVTLPLKVLIISGSGIWKSANWKNVQSIKDKLMKDDGGW
jgi:hypothetical protein